MIENLISFDTVLSPDFNISDYVGYVYLTHCIPEDKYYLGKKSFIHNVKKKLTKKELLEIPVTRGRRPTHTILQKESDWRTYYGSQPEVKLWAKKYGDENVTRQIVRFCKTKKELTYYETKYLFLLNAIEPDSKFVNSNILGTFYTYNLLDKED